MINIFNLNSTRDKKELTKYITFEKILKRIHRQIIKTSDRSIPYTIYIIPKMVLGLPTYDQIKCAIFCTDKLKANGFVVVYTHPNLIFISWDHVPSAVTNPETKEIAYDIITKPNEDHREIVFNVSKHEQFPRIKY